MRILGFDTSTGFLCVGACENEKVYEYGLGLGTKISELLVPTIKRVIKSLDWEISDVDYFAAGIGPGSFTGVRVGLAAIKALSWSLNKPVAGVSSLDILASNAPQNCDFIIPVIDAKRGLVYASIYKNQGAVLKRIAPYMLLDFQELAVKVKNKISGKALNNSVILGDGLNICAKECSAGLKGIKLLDKDYWRLEGRHLIALAKAAIEKEKTTDSFSLLPLYLYPKECQIRKNVT